MICVSGGIIMKKFKKFATFCLAAFFTFSVATLAASCKKDNDDNSTSVAYSKDYYTFVIKDTNGTAIEGINVWLCVPGDGGACGNPVATDSNGIVEYSAWSEGEGVYDIHVALPTAMNNEYTLDVTQTPATYAEVVITAQAN